VPIRTGAAVEGEISKQKLNLAKKFIFYSSAGLEFFIARQMGKPQ